MPDLDDEIIHVPLTEFSLETAETLAKSLRGLVYGEGRSERLGGMREGALSPDDEFRHLLSELWSHVVKPILDALAITVSKLIISSNHYSFNC